MSADVDPGAVKAVADALYDGADCPDGGPNCETCAARAQDDAITAIERYVEWERVTAAMQVGQIEHSLEFAQNLAAGYLELLRWVVEERRQRGDASSACPHCGYMNHRPECRWEEILRVVGR